MKTLATAIVLLVLGNFAYSQQINNSQKIIEVYGQEWYDQELLVNPSALVLLDKYIDHGFKVKTVSPGKHDDDKIHAPISEVPLRSKTGETISVEQFVQESQSPDFNPLRYGYFPENKDHIYKLQGYDLIIYVYNQTTILSK